MNRHMEHYMGIDIGTSGCKAVVFDESGNQVSKSYRSMILYHLLRAWPS